MFTYLLTHQSIYLHVYLRTYIPTKLLTYLPIIATVAVTQLLRTVGAEKL